MVLPKGRIFDGVKKLMIDAGYKFQLSGRGLRSTIKGLDISIKVMKPQNIPTLLALGKHDIGFSGYDWVVETKTKSDIQLLMDLELDKVKIVSAIPKQFEPKKLFSKKIVVASEYENITKSYLDKKGYDYHFILVHGATEVFPPEDADMIVDNCSTGTTLKENNLEILDVLLGSSTNFLASQKSMENNKKRELIKQMEMLFKSVLFARKRVVLEMNIPAAKKNIIEKLPAMKYPTVSKLAEGKGFAIKIVVKKDIVANLVPKLKKWGATDILEYQLNKVIK